MASCRSKAPTDVALATPEAVEYHLLKGSDFPRAPA